MKKPYNIILIISILIMSFSCDDVFEEDISEDLIQITAPIPNTIIRGNTVQFLWEELEGADNYRIQIMNNNRENIVDSLVSINSFTYILNPNEYQWTVRAENFAYQTEYVSQINFTVQSSDDLTNQNVSLLTPTDNIFTNSSNIIFNWTELANADTYTFILIRRGNNDQTIFEERDHTTTSINIDENVLNEDSEYRWLVGASNTISETTLTERSFFLDRVSPNQPILMLPTDQLTTGLSNITFNWSNGTDSGNVQSTITNTFQISTNIDFTTTITSETTENNSIQFEFTTPNTYYWRVRASDESGNESDYSTIRSIIVQ
ncbi:hypothetical protein D7030_08370 [Flavobacteriaceae bacterium AU392]|nr:hypothetical protein D1817_00045 [Flavobacteriaceae bacterium]RKM85133.1 hypothetical protein D7030_08370 [Flavobacteriaceae bacterium AU392]